MVIVKRDPTNGLSLCKYLWWELTIKEDNININAINTIIILIYNKWYLKIRTTIGLMPVRDPVTSSLIQSEVCHIIKQFFYSVLTKRIKRLLKTINLIVFYESYLLVSRFAFSMAISMGTDYRQYSKCSQCPSHPLNDKGNCMWAHSTHVWSLIYSMNVYSKAAYILTLYQSVYSVILFKKFGWIARFLCHTKYISFLKS